MLLTRPSKITLGEMRNTLRMLFLKNHQLTKALLRFTKFNFFFKFTFVELNG